MQEETKLMSTMDDEIGFDAKMKKLIEENSAFKKRLKREEETRK
jgi:hypothetical protein